MSQLPAPPPLKPIAVGPVTVAEPVVLAPMTGVTDMPFRTLVRRYEMQLTDIVRDLPPVYETFYASSVAERM